jgi:hypothetical protein
MVVIKVYHTDRPEVAPERDDRVVGDAAARRVVAAARAGNPPFFAVKRPARPHKRAIPNNPIGCGKRYGRLTTPRRSMGPDRLSGQNAGCRGSHGRSAIFCQLSALGSYLGQYPIVTPT